MASLPAQAQQGRAPAATPGEESQLTEGRFGQAFDTTRGGFVGDAKTQYAKLPLTVEFWVQCVDRTQEQVLLSNEARYSGTHWELVLRRGDGSLVLNAPHAVPASIDSGVSLADGAWRQVTMVWDESRVRLYVDGRLAREAALRRLARPSQPIGLAVGTRVEDRRPSRVLLDDLRISSIAREVVAAPEQPLVKDEHTISLWSFEESEQSYLARWTPGGETNQRGLPYPQRVAEYEYEKDEHWADDRWQQTDKGPFITHSTQLPGRQIGPKNTTIFLGPEKCAAALFDLERCSMSAGLTAARFTTDPLRYGLLRKPVLSGNQQFYVPPLKTWRVASADSKELTPVGKEALDYQGLYLHGNDVLLAYRVFDGEAREHAGVEGGEVTAISRELEIDHLGRDVYWTVAEMPSAEVYENDGWLAKCEKDGVVHAAALVTASPAIRLSLRRSDVLVHLPAGEHWKGKLLLWSGPKADYPKFVRLAQKSSAGPNLASFQEPAAGRWGAPLVTRGKVAAESNAPYVIDTITLPFDNPYRALFFVGGFDFFPNGDAALCTAHGDVWLVSGLDEKLDRVVWRRFATGLYQPLGLKVVDGQAIVLGRDQLTRLHDLNRDGEADYYEAFNNDLVITDADHAFAMRLETDPQGNFYFVKSGNYEPHGSALLKVTPDGSQLSVVARGFRHPYGLGVGPNGAVTVADNEGNWVPSSKIDLIREGGFYGFLGNANDAAEDVKPERPLCFIPKVADNSCGGQTWVTSDQWGGYHRGEMLHFSWGRCTLHAVLRQKVGDVWQAATVRFPGLTFLSGAGEGEFHPQDGQLYVVGLDGWQTGAVQDGCFQRVRYTGTPVYMPSSFAVEQDGVKIGFTQPLADAAARPENFRVEQWNYRWTDAYGSFHYSAKDPQAIGHDRLEIASVQRLPEENAVFLRIPHLQPVDQLHIHTDIFAADGTPLTFDIYGTVNAMTP
jgi:hypothetical protein